MGCGASTGNAPPSGMKYVDEPIEKPAKAANGVAANGAANGEAGGVGEDAAATKMQSSMRGKKARKEVEAKKVAFVEEKKEQDAAATKVQATMRGKQARKEVEAKKEGAAAAAE